MSIHNEVDHKKDYYQALGLAEDASVDDVKAAYIKLALLYHPDHLQNNKNSASEKEDVGEKFRSIAEAWHVLSKPKLRQQYHKLRGISSKGLTPDGGDDSILSVEEINRVAATSYGTQKEHFSQIVSARSNTDDVKSMTDKYRSKRWQKMALADKKIHRKLPVKSAAGVMGSSSVVWGALILVGGVMLIKSKNSN
jgi:curved DNA-binding protein CbpA